MNKNTFFIIQGPVITFGQGPNNRIEGFNTFSTITENIKHILSFGHSYILCAWKPKNEREREIIDQLCQNDINIIVIDEPKEVDPDHRFKHHFSILEAYNYVKDKCNADYFCKIRTDQLIPISGLQYILNYNGRKLIVSELMQNNPLYVGDFVYAGSRATFERFIYSQLKFRSIHFHPCIAQDIGVKFMLEMGGTIEKFSLFKDYFWNFDRISKRWMEFTQDHILTLSENIWNNIEWRGRRIGDILESSHFCFDSSKLAIAHASRFKVLFQLIDDYARFDRKTKKISFWIFLNYALRIFKRIVSR